MSWLSELGRRLAMRFRGEQFHRDLQDEMRLHLDLRQQDQIERGLAPQDAHTAARRQFGNPMVLREASGDAWGWRGLENFWQDLRYGARTLRRSPIFTAIAAITLALGIGANTAIFSVVNAVLLNPLAYQDPDRLVTVLHDGTDPVATANYLDWRDQSHSFQAMAAADYWRASLTGIDHPEYIYGLKVTQNLLPMLGVPPLLGRIFVEGEDRIGSEHEAILSAGLWERRFSHDPNVLGKAITLNGESYTIVGVMPSGFQFAPFWATRAEVWVPDAFGDSIHQRGGNHLRVFARLKPGVSLAQARADIATVTARLERQFPGTNRGVVVRPLKENVVGRIETPLFTLLAAVGFVLLIACANVAHMLLARTSDRQKEIAVRTALGAGRTRVISQFLTENLLLAALGASAGLLFALAATRALLALRPPNLPRIELVTMDARVIFFLLAITLLTAFAFGLTPALHAATGNLSGALKDGGRAGSDSLRRTRLRSFLVASEFTLAFMLLIGAGLMIRSFVALESVDPGFNPHRVLSLVVSVAGSKESVAPARAIFYRQLLQQIRQTPGVESAGAINHLPLAGDLWGWSFRIYGRPKPRPGEAPSAVYRIVMPGYFETMRLPLLRGRTIAGQDDSRAPAVAIINERAASAFWAGEDPIGKRITFDNDAVNPPTWVTVIGVAKNARQGDWASDPSPEVYLSMLQNQEFLESPAGHFAYITIVARSSGDPAALASTLKDVVWSFDPNLPVSEVLTMDQVVAEANAQPRFEVVLLTVFAAVALLLAAVGIYGVMNYAVSRRTHEIGVRISLGASRASVLRLVLRQGILQALAGTVAGVAGALLLSRFMANMLYGVRPTDPLTFSGVAALLAGVALLATLVPARKATRIEPLRALRNE